MAARALRIVTLAIAIVALCIAVAPAGATAKQPATAMRSLEQGVLAHINDLRRQHGLAPLRMSSKLVAAAKRHSTDMAARGYFSHTSANGTSTMSNQSHVAGGFGFVAECWAELL